MQCNSSSCLSQSTGSRLNFIAMKTHEAEIKSHKIMEFHSKFVCCINQLLKRDICPLILINCFFFQKMDLKRVWEMRQAFQMFDLEDESSNGLKELMQRCLMHPLYLGTEMVGSKCFFSRNLFQSPSDK